MADDRQYVTLGVGGETFAAPVENVREVLDLCRITAVPNAPAFLKGMIDVRGRTVPVVDMRAKLGLPPGEATPHTRIVVLEMQTGGDTLVIGALTDQVFEVTSLDERDIEAPPEIGVRWRSEFIHGIGRRKGAFVIVLDLATLFATEAPALRTVAA